MSARSEVRHRVRGLYAIADADTTPDPVAHAVRLLDAGVRLVQLRAKSWSEDDVLRGASDLVPRCRAVGATLIVNDHAEAAARADADGVHVGQTDASTAEVRAVLGPDRILGRSTGRVEELLAALEEADYLAFGPIFDTPRLSRPKPVRGLDLLREARRVVPARVPLVAIGGIGPANVAQVGRAGADGWAVIGALAVADVAGAVRSLTWTG